MPKTTPRQSYAAATLTTASDNADPQSEAQRGSALFQKTESGAVLVRSESNPDLEPSANILQFAQAQAQRLGIPDGCFFWADCSAA